MTEWRDTTDYISFTTPMPNEDFLSKIPLDSKIIDVGCGYGRTLTFLQSKGYYNLYGFDISPINIQTAQEALPFACLQVGDMNDFDFGKNNYDLVLLMGVIEYILQDEEQESIFNKISKSITRHGTVLLESFLIDNGANWKQYLRGFRETGHWGRFVNSKGYECHHNSVRQLFKQLREYFIIESFQRQPFTTWTGNTCKGGVFVMKKK